MTKQICINGGIGFGDNRTDLEVKATDERKWN